MKNKDNNWHHLPGVIFSRHPSGLRKYVSALFQKNALQAQWFVLFCVLFQLRSEPHDCCPFNLWFSNIKKNAKTKYRHIFSYCHQAVISK
jgi:hypothetical protein